MTSSWGPVGRPLIVPYEAPQGRRVNAIGGYFSHGPLAGEFRFATFARLPQSGTAGQELAPAVLARRALAEGLEVEEIGTIDSAVFLGFVWQLAGRPVDAPLDWRRERPLMVVVDNYQVHRSARVRLEQPLLTDADVYLVYLPSYSPELSRIEPVWRDAKYYEMPERSHPRLGDLKRAVERALAREAIRLRLAHAESAQ